MQILNIRFALGSAKTSSELNLCNLIKAAVLVVLVAIMGPARTAPCKYAIKLCQIFMIRVKIVKASSPLGLCGLQLE